MRKAKPGGFQTRVFPTFFGKGPDCVADPFGTVPRRCSYKNRPRKRKGTNRENPWTIPEQIGKIPEKSGKSQKGQKLGDCKGGVKNRNKGGCKRLFAFVHVCSRLLAFACVCASAFACVCQRLSAFVCFCSHLLTPPFVAPPSA